MQTSTKVRLKFVIGAGVGFIFALVLALILLFWSKFNGTEFAAFVLSFAVLAVAVGFAPEIQEVSIAGNVVKLREVKAEAIRAIESLNKSRVETLRVLLGLALKTGGGFASDSPVDPRIPGFWRLVNLAYEYDCVDDLKDELILGSTVLMRGQLSPISTRTLNPEFKAMRSLDEELDPVDIAPFALERTGIEEATTHCHKTADELRADIKQSFNEYQKLYALKKKLQSAI